jgi:hypothetical protein
MLNVDRMFIAESRKAARRRRRRVQVLVGIPLAVLALGAAAWWNHDWLKEETYALLNVSALKTAEEHVLKAGNAFKECRDRPEMIVVPTGTFMMARPKVKATRRSNRSIRSRSLNRSPRRSSK